MQSGACHSNVNTCEVLPIVSIVCQGIILQTLKDQLTQFTHKMEATILLTSPWRLGLPGAPFGILVVGEIIRDSLRNQICL